MDRAGISGSGNHAIKGIDLADKVSFAQSTNRRVAAHRANGTQLERHQCSSRTHTRSNSCGLNSGMASANNNDIECAHSGRFSCVIESGQRQRVSRETLLSDAEPPEQRVEHIFGRRPSQQGIEHSAGYAQVLGDQEWIAFVAGFTEHVSGAGE